MSSKPEHFDAHVRARTDVFLDVDGVLNAVTDEKPSWGWPDVERCEVNGYQITYSPTMVNRLNWLTNREHVTFHWLTTWLHDATGQLCPAIGLHGTAWAVLRDPRKIPKNTLWWKLFAIREHVEAHPLHRVLWVDDDIPYAPEALLWLESLPHGQVEVVTPNTDEGLTVELMEYIEWWLG